MNTKTYQRDVEMIDERNEEAARLTNDLKDSKPTPAERAYDLRKVRQLHAIRKQRDEALTEMVRLDNRLTDVMAQRDELLLRLKELLELADRCIDRRIWAQLDRAEAAIAKVEGKQL